MAKKTPAKKRVATKKKAPAKNKANGKKLRIPADKLWLMYQKMSQIRLFEEHVWDVYTRGLMPGLAHLYIGEEAVAVGACTALRDDDYITSTHRGHGHCLAKGGQLDRMMAEIMGKEAGYCRGKGGSMHIADMSVGILGANGIVGGGFGIATGAALSAKLRDSDQVAVCFFGDGASNQGIMLETINMAAAWNLPAIYICENNQYGEHTPYQAVTGVKDIADRAKGLGLEGLIVDGSDVLAMYEAMSNAVAKARKGAGPTLIEAKTYRFHGHHVGDAMTYRTRKEAEWWRDNKDPITLLRQYMTTNKVAKQDELDAIYKQVEGDVLAAIEFGKEAPLPPPEQAYEDLYA
ncbi:MAG: TPP-dependent pyruvate/acetoin dehydrogenase alpha subunit [Candidatus Latescibacterota bacterium]|jgi:TPP-dependent pyruvate/acetoin dehydrogenase alpha subunit